MFNRNDCEMRKLWVTLYTIQTLSRLIEHFWDRWCKECTVNLREYHSAKQQVSSKPMIKLKDLVLFHDDCVPRYLRRTGVVTELYCSNSDNQIRGASVRVKRWGQTIKRPINKLSPLEKIGEEESKGNELKEMSRRPQREDAIMGEIKRRYGHSWVARGGGVFVITSGFVIKNIFTGDIYCIARFFC